jgi:hypothetical protein
MPVFKYEEKEAVSCWSFKGKLGPQLLLSVVKPAYAPDTQGIQPIVSGLFPFDEALSQQHGAHGVESPIAKVVIGSQKQTS